MGSPGDDRPAADEIIRHSAEWVDIAEYQYSFDRLTAQRLAFLRWLSVSGRFLEDSFSNEHESGISSQAHC